jgi:hypothetical protein
VKKEGRGGKGGKKRSGKGMQRKERTEEDADNEMRISQQF